MKKKFLGIICLLYALIILFVNHYNILRNFLAPNMHIYLKCSIPVLLLMALVIFYSDRFHYKFKVLDLVLIVPLVMLIFAGDGRLSTSLAANKTNIVKKNNIKVSKSNKKDPKIDVSKLDFKNPYFEIEDDIYVDLGNYLTYNSNAEEFIGKTIRVRGFTINDNSYLPKGLYGLGKYGVSCCIADAGYMGFILDPNGHRIKKSTWYEVEGYIERKQDLSGHDIFPIKVINIKEIDGKNEEEYVYSCSQYEDQCKKLEKYNLKD